MLRDFDFRGQEVLSVKAIFVRRDSAVKLVDGLDSEGNSITQRYVRETLPNVVTRHNTCNRSVTILIAILCQQSPPN